MAAFYPLVGTIWKAGLAQTALAASKLHLLKAGFVPSQSSQLADCQANESGFDGYSAQTITAFNPPGLDPAGGAAISSPLVQFSSTPAAPPHTENVGGWFLVTTGGTLVAIGTLATPQPMGGSGQILPLVVKLIEATGA